jgi:peptidoglycan/LPS O-acetylase OafA/YrhL
MELALNLIWLAIATLALTLVPKRSRRVWFAVLAVLALLFPIISVSDDINAPWVFVDAATAPVVAMILFSVALIAIARLRSFPKTVYAVHVATPSDPRSPPVR